MSVTMALRALRFTPLILLILTLPAPDNARAGSCDEKIDTIKRFATLKNARHCTPAPGNKWFSCKRGDTTNSLLINSETGRVFGETPDSRYIEKFSRDGKFVAYIRYDEPEKIYVIDLETEKEIAVPARGLFFDFSPDSKSLLFGQPKFTLFGKKQFTLSELSLQTGKTANLSRKLNLPKFHKAHFTPDSSHVMIETASNEVFSVDPVAKKVLLVSNSSPNGRPTDFSNDGSTYVDHLGRIIRNQKIITEYSLSTTTELAPSGAAFRIVSLEFDSFEPIQFDASRKPVSTVVKLPDRIVLNQWSSNGKLFHFKGDKVLGIYDPDTQKMRTFPIPSGYDCGAKFQPGTDTILLDSCYGSGHLLFDFMKPGFKKIRIKEEVAYLGDGKFLSQDGKDAVIRQVTANCLDNSVVLSERPSGRCTECSSVASSSPGASVLGLADSVARLELTGSSERCTKPWDQTLWPDLDPIAGKSRIDPKGAELLLQAWSKPKAFQSEKHLNALAAIARSNLPQQQPDLFLDALAGIANTDPGVLDLVLDKYPHLKELKPKRSSTPPCRSPEEERSVQAQATQLIRNYVKSEPNGANQENWRSRLIPYLTVLPKMSAELKEELRDLVAQHIADRAMLNEYRSHFASRIYYYCYHGTAELFGEPVKNVSEVVLLRQPGRLVPVVLSSVPINGESGTLSPYGFHVLEKTAISNEEMPLSKDIFWSAGEKILHSGIKARIVESSNKKIPEGNAPKYDELWKDGTLNGVVMTGFSVSTAMTILNEYLAYYQAQGFRFDTPDERVPDVQAFLKNEISSGAMDYFIKEAHSDGDDQNIFTMNKSGGLKTGIKTHADGRKERIQLVYPEPSPWIAISNKNFGTWINERSKNGKGQFVYLNTSCNSSHKAVNEIEAANDPTLLNIATDSTARSFQFYRDSALLRLVHGLRNQATFKQLRQSTRDTPAFKDHGKDKFLFPDDPDYKSRIIDRLGVSYDIEAPIEDERSETYQPSHH